MNRLHLSVFSLALALSFSACDRSRTNPRRGPVPGPRTADRGTEYLDGGPSTEAPPKKPKHDEVVDPTPAPRNNIPPPPTPNNPEYAFKAEGKPGYVKSPYDTQGRLIDVRGLPPGTEAECPYTRRTFLVPP